MDILYCPVDGPLGCFIYLLLSITNKSVMNIHIQVFPGTYSFTSLGKIPKSGMTGPYERCVFNCLRSFLFFIFFHLFLLVGG